ncbi:atherin [Pongo pygmaeus]|uniref:atherin n=1 Tax=Pongo pygmaeus TaxID=9600 RepID=UPI00300C632B
MEWRGLKWMPSRVFLSPCTFHFDPPRRRRLRGLWGASWGLRGGPGRLAAQLGGGRRRVPGTPWPSALRPFVRRASPGRPQAPGGPRRARSRGVPAAPGPSGALPSAGPAQARPRPLPPPAVAPRRSARRAPPPPDPSRPAQ